MKDMGDRENKKKVISLPYGDNTLEVVVPDRIIFYGVMEYIRPADNFEELLLDRIKHPAGCETLGEMISAGEKILILIEDNTRSTPVKKILPVLIAYLKGCGIGPDDIEILTAPGTHRMMTESEIIEKVGEAVASSIKISQHDFRDSASLVDFGMVEVGAGEIPIHVNKKALDADFIIGLGNIVPHCDAGFSAGAKIVQPEICGYTTTAATHLAAALLDEIPLEDEHADLVSADLAICNSRVREKANILAVSHGLSEADLEILGYKPLKTVQDAFDFALATIPDGTIGILPRGGDCLPVLERKI
jgi:nickel-dependent lactate racemase